MHVNSPGRGYSLSDLSKNFIAFSNCPDDRKLCTTRMWTTISDINNDKTSDFDQNYGNRSGHVSPLRGRDIFQLRLCWRHPICYTWWQRCYTLQIKIIIITPSSSHLHCDSISTALQLNSNFCGLVECQQLSLNPSKYKWNCRNRVSMAAAKKSKQLLTAAPQSKRSVTHLITRPGGMTRN